MIIQEVKAGPVCEVADLPKNEELDSIEERINSTYIRAFSMFTDDYKSRIDKYRDQPGVLTEGLFYANEHYLAMKESIELQSQTIVSLESDLGNLRRQIEKEGENSDLLKARSLLEGRIAGFKAEKEKLNNLFQRLFENGHYFHGYCGSDHFEPKPSLRMVTGFEPNSYEIKPGVIPSEAIRAYIRGLTLTDCAKTINTARYQTLLDLFGEEKFNIIFAQDSKSPISFTSDQRSLTVFLKFNKQQSVVRGKNYYMSGIKTYHQKHYNGEAQGFNLLCTSDNAGSQKFIGFGLPSDGVTEKEVIQVLVNEYNREPVGRQILPEKLHQAFEFDEFNAQKYSTHTVNLNEFQSLGGGSLKKVPDEFDIDRVQQMINTPVEKVRELVDSWVDSEKKSQQQSSSSQGGPEIVYIGGADGEQGCLVS